MQWVINLGLAVISLIVSVESVGKSRRTFFGHSHFKHNYFHTGFSERRDLMMAAPKAANSSVIRVRSPLMH